jgi:hypothetical protein
MIVNFHQGQHLTDRHVFSTRKLLFAKYCARVGVDHL